MLMDELSSLNTKGFEKEVSLIKSELKNVHDIPKIEAQLEQLKKKVRGVARK